MFESRQAIRGAFLRVRTLLTPLSEFVTIRKLILTRIIKETTFQSVFTRFIIDGQSFTSFFRFSGTECFRNREILNTVKRKSWVVRCSYKALRSATAYRVDKESCKPPPPDSLACSGSDNNVLACLRLQNVQSSI